MVTSRLSEHHRVNSHTAGAEDIWVLVWKTGIPLAFCKRALLFRNKLSQLWKGCSLVYRGWMGGIK